MTTNLLLVLSALAPALVLLAVVALIPRVWPLPRPPLILGWAVLAGVISAYLALAGETALSVTPWTVQNLGGLALFTFFAVGLVEEGAKYTVMRGLLWRLKSFKEPYDGVLLAAAVGLGFGATENISYVLSSGFDVALVRAFTAVPLHGLLGVILGYYLGLAKVLEDQDQKVRWGLLLGGLAWAVVGHGFYDFLAFQSNPIAEFALWISLAVLARIGWTMIQHARQLSVSWGGSGPEPEQIFIPPVAPVRNPWVAAALGLLPGVGQFYNGEAQKGWSLMGVALVNLASFSAVWCLISFPFESLITLSSWGIGLVGNPEKPMEFINALAETPVLWVLGGMLVSFCLFGSWDAYRTAYGRTYEYLLAPPLRVKFVQSVSAAYSGHLLLVLLVALVPLFLGGGGGGGGGGRPLEFELVQAPKTLNGHRETPEGTPQGKRPKNQREQIAQAPTPPPKAKQAPNQTKPTPKKTVPAEEAKGLPRSYSDYLSYKIRQFHDLYFSQSSPDEYTVVRYVISPDGRIREADYLPDNSTTPPVVAELAVQTIRDMDPLEPLPTGTSEVVVYELFWNGAIITKTNSLEERLSMLPDGRWIEEIRP